MRGEMLNCRSLEAVYIHTSSFVEKEENKKLWNKDQSNALQKGITLVALVITIVVLLILAGITITYVLGENSVFKQASEAKEKTVIAKAREKLEIVLSEAQILKNSNQKYDLDEMILNKISESKVNGDIAIVDGYAFTLDRSIPWIGGYAGKEDELTFPELTTSVTIATDKKTATIAITAKEEKNGMKKIEVLQDGIVIKPYSYENEKGEITEKYTIARNGKYVIKATAVLTATKIENITDLVSTVQYTPNGNATWKKEHQVKVTAKENASKVKSIQYQWTNSTAEPAANSFTKTIENGGTVTENTLTGKYYLWTLLEDLDGNTRLEKSEAFWFDNTAPTVDIATEWIEDNGTNQLKITVTAKDIDSEMEDNPVKINVKQKSGEEELAVLDKNDIALGSVLVDLDKNSLYTVSCTVKDRAENEASKERYTGTDYIIKNGILVSGTPVYGFNTTSVSASTVRKCVQSCRY